MANTGLHARRTGAGWHAHLDQFQAVLLGKRAEWDELYDAAVPRYAESIQA